MPIVNTYVTVERYLQHLRDLTRKQAHAVWGAIGEGASVQRRIIFF